MIHLPPLPDYPDSPGIDKIIQHALADLRVLENGGVDGILVENEYDRPHRVEATEQTIEAMTAVTLAVVQERTRVSVGCEILLNDPKASLTVAHESGADFIRTDYFVDAMTRAEFGEFAIDPLGLMAWRSAIGADDVLIFADIQVKYAEMISPRPLIESALLACQENADAVIVTGRASGSAPTIEELRSAADGTRNFNVPVLIGSGLDPLNATDLLRACGGAIVGTSLMRNRAVDVHKLAALMAALGRKSK
jgi:membrane complex biogenesis BtpA family protein